MIHAHFFTTWGDGIRNIADGTPAMVLMGAMEREQLWKWLRAIE